MFSDGEYIGSAKIKDPPNPQMFGCCVFCDYSIVYIMIYYAQCPEINLRELLWFAQHGKIHRISPVWYTRCHCTLPPWSLRERSLHRSGGREIQRQRHPMGRSKVSIWSRGDSCRICCRWNMMKPPGGMNCYCKCSLMLSIGIFWVVFIRMETTH